jgi:hypothetical protein
VKELRLRGLSTPEDGNAYLPEFLADYNERFGCEPKSPYDAHRPLRDDEDLDLIFTWQEDRKLSRSLTLNYKRVIYLVEPGPETLTLIGERCRIHEREDGQIEIRHAGRQLPHRVFFDKNPHVTEAAVVSNKRLAGVLSKIRSDQQERDHQRLTSRRLTIRQKNRIRGAMKHASASSSQ